MEYGEKMFFVFLTEDGKKVRINVPVFMDEIDPIVLKKQVDDLLALRILSDPNNVESYLVKCENAKKVVKRIEYLLK